MSKKLVITYKGEELYNFTCAIKDLELTSTDNKDIFYELVEAYASGLGFDYTLELFDDVYNIIGTGIDWEDLGIELV